MKWRPDRYGALRVLLRGLRVEEEIEDEFEHHLQERIAANVRQGMTSSAAREDALRRFGDRSRFLTETQVIDKSILREQKRMQLFDTIRRELKQGVRGLLRSPGFTFVAIITLALGIGASTAVYTLLDAVVLNPLPYPESDRLVLIDHDVPGWKADAHWGVATASYFHYRDRAHSFDKFGAYWPNEMNLKGPSGARPGTAVQVTASFFDVLGAKPELGRLFTLEEDQPGQPWRAILSYRYWQSEFNGDRSVIGKTIDVEGEPVEIIGVTAAGFGLPDQPVDIWMQRRIAPVMNHANWHHLSVVARLKPGVTTEDARRDLASLVPDLPKEFPKVYSEDFMTSTKFAPRVQTLKAHVVGSFDRILWVVLGAVGVVLLIACVNVTNLFLVRADTRRNEFAVRSALGAESAHLALQSLCGSMVLTLTAGALAVWLAALGLRALVALAPGTIPRMDQVHIGQSSILFDLAVAVTAGVVFAMFPLLRGRVRFEPLRESGRGLTTSRAQLRVRSTLVTAQIALALVLLSAAGLMLRSFQRTLSIKSGIDASSVLAIDVSLPFARYGKYDQAASFWEQLNQKIAALPGVQGVGEVTTVPFSNPDFGCATMWVDPSPVAPGASIGCVPYSTVAPGYFEAMGIKVHGRTMTWDDLRNNTGAAVMSKNLAQRLWPGEDPIGKGVRGNGPGAAFFRVVGVTEDVRVEGLQKPPTEMVYYPMAPIPGTSLWQPATSMVVIVRSATNKPELLANGVRHGLTELDPFAAVGSVRPMETIIAQSMARLSFTMVLLGVAGGMALVLSVVGLYGVIAYVVSRRRSEIGIRMALGADRKTVGTMVVMQSMQLGVIGVTIGLVGAALTMQLLRSLLFEVQPTDPITLTTVSFFLLAVCAVASLLPARRASAVNPVEALKS